MRYGKIHAFDMETTNSKPIFSPPSLTKSLMAGFDVISNHASLILFSVLLDIFLWFGPRIQLVRLLEPFFKQADSLSEMSGSTEILRQGTEQFSLLSTLRSFPIGVPSLIASRSAQSNPMGSPLVFEINSAWVAFAIWLGLFLIGVGAGTLYFNFVAQAAFSGRLNMMDSLTTWPSEFCSNSIIDPFLVFADPSLYSANGLHIILSFDTWDRPWSAPLGDRDLFRWDYRLDDDPLVFLTTWHHCAP